MSKYKKIFSGLGLLSISTLVGASVVACANKKPKASDSSTEAIDQNNNQGNSTKPDQMIKEIHQNQKKEKIHLEIQLQKHLKHQKNLNLHKIQHQITQKSRKFYSWNT
ncbi:hypothetical protein NWQ33_04860 [Mycoplasmopsis cynos]|nr:hypothetical protein [Mycoplasmopsis cynos]